MSSFYPQNFDEMLGEILDVIPDANEQDVRKKLLATSSVEETLDWMLEQQSNYVYTFFCNLVHKFTVYFLTNI